MQKYQNNVTNRNGDAAVGVKVAVTTNGVSAVIYSDNGLTPTGNPLTTDANGYFEFYAADGRYNIVVADAAGYTDVIVADTLELLPQANQAAATAIEQAAIATEQAETVDAVLSGAVKNQMVTVGATGDGTTDDTAYVAPASDAAGLPKVFLVTSFADVRGQNLMPGDIAQDNVSGRVFNPRLQSTMVSFGQETLQYWFNKFAGASNINAGDSTIRRMVLSGDSTTFGVGATAGRGPDYLMTQLARARGYINTAVFNNGRSGRSAQQWVQKPSPDGNALSYCEQDLATAPDVLVIRWGANDAFFGRTVEQTIADLRTGLATCRAAKTVAQMSIVIMTPSTMNDIEKGRSQAMREQIDGAIRQMARDYDCAFIDTYSALQNSHSAAAIWMDQDFSFSPIGRAIHPHDVMYEHIAGLMADMLLPIHGVDWLTNTFRNNSAGDPGTVRSGAELPQAFFSGLEFSRMGDNAPNITGKPYNGAHYTFKQADGICWQVSVPYPGSGGAGMSFRLAFQNAWSNWYGADYDGTPLLQSGWTNLDPATNQPFIYQLTLEGRVVINGMLGIGTTADETPVFTLPAGFRPRKQELFIILSESGYCKLKIDTAGVAKIFSFVPKPASLQDYIGLNGISFRVAG